MRAGGATPDRLFDIFQCVQPLVDSRLLQEYLAHKKQILLGPYRRPMPEALRWSEPRVDPRLFRELCHPLPSEDDTYKTVKARFWPWLDSGLGFQVKVLKKFLIVCFSMESGISPATRRYLFRALCCIRTYQRD